MEKIILKTIRLENFKGVREVEIVFDEVTTTILGDNATGKTTIFDAFTWLLFGKDHSDNTKFEIKTLDKHNNAIPKINHEVEAKLYVDGVEVRLKRVYKEKWTKQRGSDETLLTGHTTDFYYDEIPISLKDYTERVGKLLNEELFKLLTNPFYFNSMAWKDRRSILTKISEVPTDDVLAAGNDDFVKLLEEMKGKTFDDFKALINSKKRHIKDQIKEIPTRIDEIDNGLPEEKDWDLIRKDIEEVNSIIEKTDEQIVDNSKIDASHAELISEKQKELSEAKAAINALEQKARDKYFQAKSKQSDLINNAQNEVQSLGFEIKRLENKAENQIREKREIEQNIAELRDVFAKKREVELVVDEEGFNCPTCKRDFEPWKIDEIKSAAQSNFNATKAKELEEINGKGKLLKDKKIALVEKIADNHLLLEAAKEKYVQSNASLEALEKSKEEFKEFEFVDLNAYEKATQDIAKINEEIIKLRTETKVIDSELISKLQSVKTEAKSKLKELEYALYQEKQIQSGKDRIELLERENKVLSQELSDLEQKEYVAEQFSAHKIDKIEESINALFPTVRFKLFAIQINGGYVECCDTLINGVPFSDANNASKIQSGIEIINVLTKYHRISAPIFVDNAESIVKIQPTSSQLIKLVVSEKYKSLTLN